MWFILLFLVALAVLAYGLEWIIDQPGSLTLDWGEFHVDTSIPVAVGGLVLTVAALMLLWAPLGLSGFWPATLDVLAGWAVLAREWDYCQPQLDAGEVLSITDGRHPVVEQMMKQERPGLAGSGPRDRDPWARVCSHRVTLPSARWAPRPARRLSSRRRSRRGYGRPA